MPGRFQMPDRAFQICVPERCLNSPKVYLGCQMSGCKCRPELVEPVTILVQSGPDRLPV